MTCVAVIEEIKRLPKDEQTRVLEFTRQVVANHPLSPEELGDLARQLVEAHDSAEADRLKQQIIPVFYGGESHA